MSIFDAISELCTMPIRCLGEIVDDLSEKNYEEDKYLSMLTLGASSVIKGIGKTIKKSVDRLD